MTKLVSLCCLVMKKSEEVYSFLLKLNQSFKHCFNVLCSCETVEQIQNTTNWFVEVISNLEKEKSMICSNLSRKESLYLSQEFLDRCNLMSDQWNEYTSAHSAIQPKNSYIVIKGFS